MSFFFSFFCYIPKKVTRLLLNKLFLANKKVLRSDAWSRRLSLILLPFIINPARESWWMCFSVPPVLTYRRVLQLCPLRNWFFFLSFHSFSWWPPSLNCWESWTKNYSFFLLFKMGAENFFLGYQSMLATGKDSLHWLNLLV